MSIVRTMTGSMSLDMTVPLAELPEVPDALAARTGVWTIRPDQALRWSRVSQPAPEREVGPFLRALAVIAMVLVAGLLGGVGAWAITS